jgi:hypothetical protein
MNRYPSIQSIKNSPCGNRNEHLFEEKPVKKNKIVLQKRSKEKDWLSWNLQYWCNEKALTLETEYQFHPARKYRFDWAISALMIAIEFEGIISKKSRHTTVTGYSKDTDKYREASKAGWILLRYTVLNYKQVLSDLNEIINAK